MSVDSFVNGWCLAMNIVHERTRRAAAELGGAVVFQEVVTSDRNAFMEWASPVDSTSTKKQVRTGSLPSYETIRNLIVMCLK